jgi:hypothetical protein
VNGVPRPLVTVVGEASAPGRAAAFRVSRTKAGEDQGGPGPGQV